MKLLAYTEAPTFAPGDAVNLFVSTTADEYDVELVRVRGSTRGVENGRIPLRTDSVRCDGAGRYRGRLQPLRSGSFASSTIVLGQRTAALEIEITALHTLPGSTTPQCVLAIDSHGAVVIAIVAGRDGELTLELGGEPVAALGVSEWGRWTSIAVTVDFETGAATLGDGVESVVAELDAGRLDDLAKSLFDRPLRLMLAARPIDTCTRDHFDGKLESPALWLRQAGSGDRQLACSWDLTDWTTPDEVPVSRDLAPLPSVSAAPLKLTNRPLRACTGRAWDGTALDWRAAPGHYAAIHFHADDVDDAGWESDAALTLPDDLPSGVYGLSVTTADGGRSIVPLFVPRRASTKPARVAVLASTFTYLAYSNKAMQSSDPEAIGIVNRGVLNTVTDFISVTPELGWSTYNRHPDDSGISHVAWARPKPDTDPDCPNWLIGAGFNLSADMRLLAWLDDEGVVYDIVTDDQLDEHGVDALTGHSVVLTGTHPEYVTAAELEAIESYVAGGGNVMYLGGNGFYWVVTRLPGRCAIELRRGQSGTRGWESACGESTHSNGEPGGLWRHRGHAPQKLFGVGFASQGFASAAPYRVLDVPAAAAFVLAGVEATTIGLKGGTLGGAAGEEIDRIDHRLGSPAQTIRIATSEGLQGADYFRAIEDCLFATPRMSGPNDSMVRADVALIPGRDGRGSVFATGSISWCSVLGDDADVARITKNVLDAFVGLAPGCECVKHGVVSPEEPAV